MFDTTVSRRAFLGGAAAGAVGAAAACTLPGSKAVADEAPATLGTRYTPYSNPDEIGIVHEASSEETVAAVFVGTGIGGMMGAMICAEQMPDLKILLVEKNSFCGGNTNFAERNAPKPGTDWETALREGKTIAEESYYIKDGRLYAERAYDYGKNSAWMYLKHHFKLRHSTGFTDMYEGGNGTIPIQNLQNEIETDPTYANLELRLETRATALLLDDEYTCTGVQLRNADGTYTDVHANAVVLCTGGMSNNLDLLQYYSGQDICKCEAYSTGQDGDGHLMVEQTAHGKCKTIALSSLLVHVRDFPMDSVLSVAAGMNATALWVNQEGERFTDESSLNDVLHCKAVEQQGKVFSIIGSNLMKYYEDGGMARMAAFGENVGNQPWDPTDELEANKDNENMFVADTIEELAEQMGVPADALAATVERYDADCEAGTGDTLYEKPAESMVALGEGPYYGFRLTSCLLSANNGIRVNHNSQVVDPYYNPIKGLYAAGICISGFNTEIYYVATCQSVSTWGGSKAARHLIENCCGRTVADDWFGDEEYTEDSIVEYEDDE